LFSLKFARRICSSSYRHASIHAFYLFVWTIEVDGDLRTIHRSFNRDTFVLTQSEVFLPLFFFCSSHNDSWLLFFVLAIGVDGELLPISAFTFAEHQNTCSISCFFVEFIPLFVVVQVSMWFTSHVGIEVDDKLRTFQRPSDINVLILVRSQVYSSNLSLFFSECKYPCGLLIALTIGVDDELRSINRSSNRDAFILARSKVFSSLFSVRRRRIHAVYFSSWQLEWIVSFVWSELQLSETLNFLFCLEFSCRIRFSFRRRASIRAACSSCWRLAWMVSFVQSKHYLSKTSKILVQSRVFSSDSFLFSSSCKCPCGLLLMLTIEVDGELLTTQWLFNRNVLILVRSEVILVFFFSSSYKDPYSFFCVGK